MEPADQPTDRYRVAYDWARPDAIAERLVGELAPGVVVWDLGCGAGRHALTLAEQGFSVIASDVSQQAITKTRKLLEEHGQKAEYHVASFAERILPPASIDAVLSTNVINHGTFDEVRNGAAEIERALKRGGIVALLVLGAADFRYGMGAPVESSPRTFVFDRGPEQGITHYFFRRDDFAELLPGCDSEVAGMTRPAFTVDDQKDSVIAGLEDWYAERKAWLSGIQDHGGEPPHGAGRGAGGELALVREHFTVYGRKRA